MMDIVQRKRISPVFATPENLDEISYCINCTDLRTGLRGTFAYDETFYRYRLGHFAISPVCDTVDQFYTWCKREGFAYHKLGEMLTRTRYFE